MAAAVIELRGVAISKGSHYLYQDVGWKIEKGDFWGFIGSNGTGKSVLLRAIMGLEQFEGEILLFGKPAREFRQWEKIGYVPQRSFMFERNFPASVREIIESGLPSSAKSSERPALVAEAAEIMGISDLLDERIGVLSGGQMQRAVVARAIAAKPEVLILDEPTAGVDFVSESMLYNFLEKLNKKGVTIIMVSHDIGAISKKARKIACLHERKLSMGCNAFDSTDHLGEHRSGFKPISHSHAH